MPDAPPIPAEGLEKSFGSARAPWMAGAFVVFGSLAVRADRPV